MPKASVMEMRMVLAIATRSLHGIEAAQEGLAIQHRDLGRQVEWIKEEIRKADFPEPESTKHTVANDSQLELLVSKICHCRKCLEDRNDQITPMTRMIVCPICGNKRCPTANDHRNACTNSNEPGQPGSAY